MNFGLDTNLKPRRAHAEALVVVFKIFFRFNSWNEEKSPKRTQNKMHENFRFIEKLFKLNRLIFKKKILLFNVSCPEV